MYLIKLIREHILKNNERKYFLLLSIFIFISTLTVFIYDNNFFSSYLGKINPIMISMIFIIIGLFSNVLIDETIIPNKKMQTNKIETILYIFFGLIWACVLIPIDLFYKLPNELNELFPKSIVFYPLLAFYVELLFHIIPFSILILFFRISIFNKLSQKKKIMIIASIVLLIEPLYQITLPYLFKYHISLTIFVTIYSLIFNSVQIFTLVRKKVITMIFIRISQYIIWHVLWGLLRSEYLK